MKATVQYIASKMPAFIMNVPIVQKREGNEAVNFSNKDDLLSFVDSQGEHPESDRYLIITCQCGTVYDYVAKTDVPATDLICSCGRTVIKYS